MSLKAVMKASPVGAPGRYTSEENKKNQHTLPVQTQYTAPRSQSICATFVDMLKSCVLTQASTPYPELYEWKEALQPCAADFICIGALETVRSLLLIG